MHMRPAMMWLSGFFCGAGLILVLTNLHSVT